MEEDTNKWKRTLCSRMGELTSLNVQLKAICRLSAIPVKIPMVSFHRTGANIPKMYLEPQKTPNSHSNPEKGRTKLEESYYLISNHTIRL